MHPAEHVSEHLLEELASKVCFDNAGDVFEHLSVCAVCQDRLTEIFEFVAFQQAEPSEAAGQIRARHELDGGTVFLVVTGSDARDWEARAIGAGLQITRRFARGREAKAWLEYLFATRFAGHRCGPGCAAGWR